MCLFFLFIVGALIFLSYFLFYSHLRILHCSLFLSIYYFCYPYCVLFPHFLLSVYYEGKKLSSPFSSHYHFLSFDLLIFFSPFPTIPFLSLLLLVLALLVLILLWWAGELLVLVLSCVVLLCCASTYTLAYNTWWGLSLLASHIKGIFHQ